MRINKYLAMCGVASRRKCDEILLQGKVKVNGKVCKEPGFDVSDSDQITVDNKPVKLVNNFVYYKLNKPKGYLTTLSDDRNRKTITDLLRGVHARVFPVGRLDYSSEGLLLVTNDGETANIFMHPRNEIFKKYIVKIEGGITPEQIKKLEKGVSIGEGIVTGECKINLLEKDDKSTRLEFIISEGKNRQIRKMLENQGKSIIMLKRVQIGEIALGGLSRGEYAALNKKEMAYINKLKAKYAEK